MRSPGKQDRNHQTNTTQSSELDPHRYGNLILTELRLQSSGENMNHSINIAGTHFKRKNRGTWLAQLVECVTLDLGVVNSRRLGEEIT